MVSNPNLDSKSAFQVPLNQIASTALPAKNEVSLEFAASTDPARKRHDALVEIRLYVPGTQSQSNDDDLLDEDEVGLKPDKEPISNATYLHDAIRQRGDIETSIGEAIVTFKDVLCIVPRGRFEVEMHSLFFRLRGKSHDYKILFTSISKMILVPKVYIL